MRFIAELTTWLRPRVMFPDLWYSEFRAAAEAFSFTETPAPGM
jgi:hypothetical protein